MRRRTVFWIAVAATLAIVGGATAWWLLSRPPGPEDAARAYVEALAAGDAEGALAVTRVTSADLGVDATAAFAGADAHPADPRLDSVAAEGGKTRATVTFTLDGEELTVSFGLVERDGRWLVDRDGLGILEASTTLGDGVLIGGADAPSGSAALLLPAVYPVHAAPIGILTGETTARVLPGATGAVAVDASIAPEATALAQARIDDYAAACARTAPAVPDHCGLRVPWAADLARLDEIAFRIEQTPQVALSSDLRTFAATGGVIVATASGTARDGNAMSFTYRADDWALRGTVTLTSEGMQLAVN